MVTDMNTYQQFMMAITAAVIFTSFVGYASGDLPVYAVPGLEGISTSTSFDADGIVTTSTIMSLQLASHTLNDPPLENGGWLNTWYPNGPFPPYIDGYTVDPWVGEILGTPLPAGEVQYTAG
jgi:hypothetical protein